jgi:hypothetical protein
MATASGKRGAKRVLGGIRGLFGGIRSWSAAGAVVEWGRLATWGRNDAVESPSAVGSSLPTGEVMTDGGYQAILWDPVQVVAYGANESRKDGQAAGY